MLIPFVLQYLLSCLLIWLFYFILQNVHISHSFFNCIAQFLVVCGGFLYIWILTLVIVSIFNLEFREILCCFSI